MNSKCSWIEDLIAFNVTDAHAKNPYGIKTGDVIWIPKSIIDGSKKLYPNGTGTEVVRSVQR